MHTLNLTSDLSCPGVDEHVASLKEQIESLDGKVARTITPSTTHLVATPKDFDANTNKVAHAVDAVSTSGIKIVGFEWLEAVFTTNVKPNEDIYLLATPPSSATPPPEPKKTRKKRARDEDDVDEAALLDGWTQPPAKRTRDGQKARSAYVHVPVDENCNMSAQQCVYIDRDRIIWDANLNQTNAGRNNNKFYRMQIIAKKPTREFWTWTRWGRVGEPGQHNIIGHGDLGSAIASFEKKFKEKTGHKWEDRLADPIPGKYTFLERNYEPDSEYEDESGQLSRRGSKDSGTSVRKVAPCTLTPPVQELLQLIFNHHLFAAAMSSMNYDNSKLPLGKLSKTTLGRGFRILRDLAELKADPSLATSKYQRGYTQAVQDLSNSYYSTIPHIFGRCRPPVIDESRLLKQEIEMLESLSDMSIARDIMKGPAGGEDDEEELPHPLDRQFQGLQLDEMTPLDHASAEFKQLEDYLLKSRGKTHFFVYTVQEIFRIERAGERQRFAASPYAAATTTTTDGRSDRRLLWHGSRVTNFGGILSQGLRIAPPEAPASGYMFGKGAYLADMSSKSANYCASAESDQTGLLLLCEAELGRPMLELKDADYKAGQRAADEGRWSTWGQGTTVPGGWKDARCVNPMLEGVLMVSRLFPLLRVEVTACSRVVALAGHGEGCHRSAEEHHTVLAVQRVHLCVPTLFTRWLPG